MIKRRKTKEIFVGDIGVGGTHPISVQSMTTTKTSDVDSTLGQIYELAQNGADIVRVTCNNIEAAKSMVSICERSPVPIIADIHYQYRLALGAVEAGVHGLRLNPGNIRDEKKIKEVFKPKIIETKLFPKYKKDGSVARNAVTEAGQGTRLTDEELIEINDFSISFRRKGVR